MNRVVDASSKPLPVVLRAARDELLSSWLARHARFYGVTGPFFAKWLGLGDIRLSTLDHRLSLGQVARLTDKFRCDPVTLINMTHIDTRDGQVCNLISRGRAAQICYPCADRYAQDGAEGTVSKHWSKAWRITCPACGLAFTDTNEHRGSRATLLETTPFEDLWSEAVAGEQIVEQYLAEGKHAEHSPIAVLQLLLVQTWKPITGNLEHPVVGWVLGTLFPNFDVRAQPIKRRVTHTAIASLPMEFRPALLAGLARVSADPAVLHDLRKATLLRGQRNFDKFFREANFELPLARRLSHQ
jgi:TniQ